MFVFFIFIPPYRVAPPNEKEQVIQRRTDRGYAIRSRSDVIIFGRCSIAPSHPETRVPSLNTFYEKVRKTLLLHITFLLYLLSCNCPIFRTIVELTFNLYIMWANAVRPYIEFSTSLSRILPLCPRVSCLLF